LRTDSELWAIELVKRVSLPIEDLSLDLLFENELGGCQNPFCLTINGKKEITTNIRTLLATDMLHHRNSRKARQSREAKLSRARNIHIGIYTKVIS